MFKGFANILQHFVKFIDDNTKDVFRRYGKDATGKTIDSIRTAVDIEPRKAIEIDVFGGSWIEFIEKGRPKNSKLPPQGVLLDWMRARGIALSKEFIIRRGIAENGILPTPVIEVSFEEIHKEFITKTAPKLVLDVANTLAQAIKEGFKF